MRRVLYVGMVAALACACGRKETTTTTTAETAQPAATTPAAGTADSNGATGTSGSSELVTLTGCLLRAPDTNAVGTTGTASAGSAQPNATPAPPAGDRFVLNNAKPADASGAPAAGSGVGQKGAGASGGPLVTGTSSYALEGSADLLSHENQQVSITGRLITEDALAGGVLSGGSATAARPRRVSVDSVATVAATCKTK